MKLVFLAALSIVALTACDRPAPEPAASEQSRGVVDSTFPVDEEIRRFKARVGGPFPTVLENGASSRADLARRFITALEQSDTTALHQLVINAREFIQLYYPYSQFTKPPYRQSPALLWFLMTQNGEKGLSRALVRYGGQPAGYRSLACEPAPIAQERNRLWECVVHWQAAEGKPDPLRLFGSIIERDGRFKFLSYANAL